MKGLWHVPSRAIDPGIGVVIFDGLVALLILLFTSISIARRSKLWPEARILHVGMALLSIWSILHWTDVEVHHSRARVRYNYIIADCFYRAFRVFSDFFILCGTWRVLIRYLYLRPSIWEPQFAFFIAVAGLLWILALYHLLLLFALSFAWLAFADLDTINSIAQSRSGFEIAFTTLQLVCTIVTVIFVVLMLRETLTRSRYKKVIFLVPASAALLIRSFCEVVIVGQLNLLPKHIQTISKVRHTTYGLFSVIFMGCITLAVPANSAEDPLLEMEKTAVDEVSAWLHWRLEEVTQQRKKMAPTILTVLKPLEQSLAAANHKADSVAGMKKGEVKRLKKLYADWEPIYKWPGADAEPRRKSSVTPS